MLCWRRWIIMSHRHKQSRTSFGGKGELCGKDFRHIQGDGDGWVPPCWHEMKCKRNAAVQVHMASPLFLRSVSWHMGRATSHSCLSLSKTKRSDVAPRWHTAWLRVDPWQLECPAVPGTDPVTRGSCCPTPLSMFLQDHPLLCGPKQNQVSNMTKLSPTFALWSFCQQLPALKDLGLP